MTTTDGQDPKPEETPAQSAGAPPPGDPAENAMSENERTNAGAEAAKAEVTPDPAATVNADDLSADAKLGDPVATGELPSDPAASIEKTAESAAPAPEGAQPADAAAKAATDAAPAPKAARPAKEVEPKEAPRVAPPAGSINEIILALLPDVQAKAYMVPSLIGEHVAMEVAPADVPAVLTACRDDERLDMKYLRNLSGVDWQEEGLEVVYHLGSLTKKHNLTLKTRVTYDEPSVPSVATLFPSADWHERETRDMFGINFEGHWNLVPLLLPEDMTDHFPLRKDNPLQEIEEWQGDNLRGDAGEGDE